MVRNVTVCSKINGISDTMMMAEIVKELTVIKNTNEITNEHGLTLAKSVEAQRAMLMNIQERDFNMIRHVNFNTSKYSNA